MPIITLISDMGTQDHYVAAVKGYLYTQASDLNVVDITHAISHFNLPQAAFVLGQVFRDFPKGTIHLIGVDTESDFEKAHLLVGKEDHWFIGADNGIFALLFESSEADIYELNLRQDGDSLAFPLKDVFAKAAIHLARGGTAEVIGKRRNSFKQFNLIPANIKENLIEGRIIHIDSYGNLITNINRSQFREWLNGRTFEIIYRDFDGQGIRKIHDRYGEVAEGDRVAVFNSGNLLEIALNRGAKGSGGGANKLLGAKVNDIIRIKADDY